jgi:hypothetical protein
VGAIAPGIGFSGGVGSPLGMSSRPFWWGEASRKTTWFSRSIVVSKKPNGGLHLSVAEPLVHSTITL